MGVFHLKEAWMRHLTAALSLGLALVLVSPAGMARAGADAAQPATTQTPPVAEGPISPWAERSRVTVRVSISRQMMEVWHEGRKLYDWPVSTARAGKVTPTGTWNGAQWLSRNHRSSRYNNAPMPFAIFYNGHYAIHGTDQVRKLGSPASAGCVRLHPDHAKVLFNMVRHEGKDQLKVIVVR
jgi:lipoprotein-anchoring transpeptidase ErfK/SrfK